MNTVDIKLKTGRVQLQFTQLSGDNIVFVHFEPEGEFTLSAYKEWKLRFSEILDLAALLGADEVLSFVPKNKPKALPLQQKFGFEVIGEVPEGTLTRCADYGTWCSDR